MSRLGPRRSLSIAVATLATLIAPAAAHAATYTVKTGDGPCGGSDLACGGLVQAAAAAKPGDVFNVATGTYPAPTFLVGGVTINGGLGVTINGTIEFAGPTGNPSVLSKVAVSQGTSAAPGIYVSGESGLVLSDSVVVSRDGFGILIVASQANKISRTVVATGGQATGAIQVESGPGTAKKAVVVESSIMYGGGAGIRAITRNNEAEGLAGRSAGDIDLTLRHITAAGSTNGIDIDSSNARTLLLAGRGDIHATVTDSIALNNRVVNFAGTLNLGVLLGANVASLTTLRTIDSGDPATLFVNPSGANFRLRPDSPAIGQGDVTPGESATDIDGEDRATAPTDFGADEYNPAAPTAAVVVATPAPKSGQPVIFDGRGSSDRDSAGGALAQYRWRFSDGKTEVTTSPVLQHVFAEDGDGAVGLTVVNAAGAVSTEATALFKITDGVPPAVGIAAPKNNKTFRTFTTKTVTVKKNGKAVRDAKGKAKTKKTRTRTKIQIAGLSADKSGVARILLTIEKLGGTSKTQCRWYDSKRGFRVRSCKNPVLLNAKLTKDDKNGAWTYNVPTTKPLSAGTYRIVSYGVDKAGAFGNSAEAKLSTIRIVVKN